MSGALVKEVLKPALRTVDAIMSKFGVGKKDAQKFLNSKFKREQVKGGAKVAAVGTGLWAASNFMKAKLGVYPTVGPSGAKATSSKTKVAKPGSKGGVSKGLGTKEGKVNRGGGPRLGYNQRWKRSSEFDKAFREARDKGKIGFMWKGKLITTEQKEEDPKENPKLTFGAGKHGTKSVGLGRKKVD